jgi:subtilisin family serine protease
VTVAVVDTGVDYLHQDIAPNYVYGRSYINAADLPPGYTLLEPGDEQDYYGHGTHVAGSIAAPITQGRIIGVAPEAKIANYKVLAVCTDPDGKTVGVGFDSWILPAIMDAADDGRQVINMSIGGYADLTNPEDLASYMAWCRATKYAWDKGTLVVAAAGNEEVDLSRGPDRNIPSMTPHALSISATGPFDELAVYSNYGAFNVDFAAPGGDVPEEEYDGWWVDYLCLSALFFDGTYHWYAWMGGTSMATPKVCGVAALIYAHNPGIGPDGVVRILEGSVDDLGAAGYDFQFGWGLPDARQVFGIE